MTRDLARYLDVMATYGAAGESRALAALGIVRPSGALDVGKGAFAMLGPEVVAKLAAVKTALPPVPGKATAPTLADVSSDITNVLADRPMPLMIPEGVVPPEVLDAEYRRSTTLAVAAGPAIRRALGERRGLLRFDADRRPENVVGIGVPAALSNWWVDLMASGIGRLLITDPTDEDVERPGRELGVRVDASLAGAMAATPFDRRTWNPAGEGGQPTHFPWPDAATCVVDVFRVMRAMTFDSPMPLLGATNLYAWLVRRGFRILLIDDPSMVSTGVPGWRLVGGSYTPPTIRLNLRALITRAPIHSGERWDEAEARLASLGMYVERIAGFIAHLMHEAGHARGNYPHTCNNGSPWTGRLAAQYGGEWNDLNFAYGGAWAVQQETVEYMGQLTGGFFPPMTRQNLMLLRDAIRRDGYCGAI